MYVLAFFVRGQINLRFRKNFNHPWWVYFRMLKIYAHFIF